MGQKDSKNAIQVNKKSNSIKESVNSNEDIKPDKKTIQPPKIKKSSKRVSNENSQALSKRVKKEEEQDRWKWWEEQTSNNQTKWTTLDHKGPVFPPPYEPLPEDVKMLYCGKQISLSPAAEEVAGFYARMLDHEYTTKEAFRKNFFEDWRTVMTEGERRMILDLDSCDFKPLNDYFCKQSELKKAMSKEEKQAVKEANLRLQEEFGFCTLDGHRERIGNFKIEPPGLFRGRGNHPKMGKLKGRIRPEDVTINCGKTAVVAPPPGSQWKDVIHDNTVSFLASWMEPVLGGLKYIMLASSSKLKGVKDLEKYQVARKLHSFINNIRDNYKRDLKSNDIRIKQRAVALYFIDRLALRAGNEKDEETADTVGCCSLRVEHVTLLPDLVVKFDFLGKDSIRYQNEVTVAKRVYKNLETFMRDKRSEDSLFDSLSTSSLNKYLQELMPGLTAKVFRTYNASVTLEEQLNELTKSDSNTAEKVLSYNRANRAVAILCNHQRSVPKTFVKSMDNMQRKIEEKTASIEELEKEAKIRQADYAKCQTEAKRKSYEAMQKKIVTAKNALSKLKMTATDRDESKQIAMGTSKLNYLDPRISVAWCQKNDVPIEKIYNKTQRDKFNWAIEMTDDGYKFASS